MSALAGVWDFRGRDDGGERCRAMLAAQSAFGPHASNQVTTNSVAIGRNLTRTLPEDVFDTQPLCSTDGRFFLVADVRLDNRDELVGDLAILPSRAHELADSAIVLATFERWGADAFERLAGDFAVAVWDVRERRLTLARDYRGGRSLFYHRAPAFIAFSTMPKGLHALADVPRAPDIERVVKFLVLAPDWSSRTFFRGVERVIPGHVLTVSQDGVTMRRYWQPQRKILQLKDTGAYVEAARHYFDLAMRASLRGAPGTVGAHLSGGLDSSGVVATAARHLAPSGRRVVAYTSFPRNGSMDTKRLRRFADERRHAAAVAELYPNIEHVLVPCLTRPLLAGIDTEFDFFEAPRPDLFNRAWGNAIFDDAKCRGLSVLLTGDAGNITLSYDGAPLLPELFSSGRLLQWANESGALVWRGDRRWRGIVMDTVAPFAPQHIWKILLRLNYGSNMGAASHSPVRAEHLSAFQKNKVGDGAGFYKRPAKNSFDARLEAMYRWDGVTSHAGVLAAWGIDVRAPLMDRRLVEFCLSVPTEQFLSEGVTRALARRTLADRLPTIVIDERRRGLQAADWQESLAEARGDVAAEIERQAQCQETAELLDIDVMRARLNAFCIDEQDAARLMDYRVSLLSSMAIGIFVRKAAEPIRP